MKNIFLFIVCMLIVSLSASSQVQKIQNLQVGNTIMPFESSAVLQVNDTSRGFLPPRMTTEQRTEIANPANGLQVYDTDLNNIVFYNGFSWVQSGGTHKFVNGTNMADAVFTGGNVGIGLSDPVADLHIRAKQQFSNAELNIQAGWENQRAILSLSTPNSFTANIKKTAIIAQGISSNSRADLHFVLNSIPNEDNYVIGDDTKMIIKNNGFVGIGTITPSEKLDVQGGVKVISGSNLTLKSDNLGNATLFSGDISSNQTAGLNFQVGNVGTLSNTRGASINLFGNAQDNPTSTGRAGSIVLNTSTDVNITSPNGNNIFLRTLNTDRLVVKSEGNVGIGTSTPQNSAQLEVNSTTRGFLPPRMNSIQMNLINSPAEGLVVYCSDCTPIKGLRVFDGVAWVTLQ